MRNEKVQIEERIKCYQSSFRRTYLRDLGLVLQCDAFCLCAEKIPIKKLIHFLARVALCENGWCVFRVPYNKSILSQSTQLIFVTSKKRTCFSLGLVIRRMSRRKSSVQRLYNRMLNKKPLINNPLFKENFRHCLQPPSPPCIFHGHLLEIINIRARRRRCSVFDLGVSGGTSRSPPRKVL